MRFMQNFLINSFMYYDDDDDDVDSYQEKESGGDSYCCNYFGRAKTKNFMINVNKS